MGVRMDKKDFNEYLSGRYDDQVKYYSNRAALNKNLNYLFQGIIIIASSIVPIFAALEYKEFTIILSAIVAISSGILGLCKFGNKWHIYRNTSETLKQEKSYYKSKSYDYGKVNDPEQLFVERVESIILKERKDWSTILKKDKDKKKNN